MVDEVRPEPKTTPDMNHPTLARLKERFAGAGLRAGQYRGDVTVIVPAQRLHEVMQFLRTDTESDYNFLSDVFGVDYLNYPKAEGRFAVIYNLVSYRFNRRLFVKVLLNPTLDTSGTLDDPALHVDSVTDIWPGAEWNEREVFDMFGIRFDNHPDLRRILLWEAYPAHPLRKDYPITGRGEREQLRVVPRDSA